MSCVCAERPGCWIALLRYSKQHMHACICFIIHTQACKHMFFPLMTCVYYLRLVFWLSGATREPFGVGLVEKVTEEKFTDRNKSFIGNSMMGQKWQKTGF